MCAIQMMFEQVMKSARSFKLIAIDARKAGVSDVVVHAGAMARQLLDHAEDLLVIINDSKNIRYVGFDDGEEGEMGRKFMVEEKYGM